MPELLLTDKCNQTQHRLKIKVNFSEHSSSLRPLWRSGSDLNRNLWLYGCGEKEGPLIVVWVPYTGSHGVVWFFPVLLQCIASCIHGLPYRGGRVSSISDSPISVTPPLKYWAGEKQNPKILGLDQISGTRFWLSGPRSGLNGGMILYFWRETRDL